MATDPMAGIVRLPGATVVRFGFDVLDRVELASSSSSRGWRAGG